MAEKANNLSEMNLPLWNNHLRRVPLYILRCLILSLRAIASFIVALLDPSFFLTPQVHDHPAFSSPPGSPPQTGGQTP